MTISISKQQMKIMESFALENYINELVIHCDSSFPHLRKTMGEEKLKSTLKTAVDKAEKNSFTQRGSVQFYIDMLIVFGWGGGNDPQYPWIRNSLEKNRHLSQIERTTVLYCETEKYLNRISGKDSQYLFIAAEKLEQLNIESIKVDNKTLIQDILVTLKNIYPQKYEVSGDGCLTKLVTRSIEKAKKNYYFEQPNQIALISILMFLLGQDFDADPFYQWASIEVTSKNGSLIAVGNTDKMASRLEKRAKVWLSASVNNEHILLNLSNKKEERVI